MEHGKRTVMCHNLSACFSGKENDMPFHSTLSRNLRKKSRRRRNEKIKNGRRKTANNLNFINRPVT